MTRFRELGYLLLGLAIGIAIRAGTADELRFEAGLGTCRHNLAPDASWHYAYGGYETNMTLSPACGQLGLLWMPTKRWGVRAAYVDLGRIDANNTYPVDEPAYFRAKDTGTAVQSATARFQGSGRARGFTLGPVYERHVLGLDLSGELGAAAIYTNWHVDLIDSTWRYADGWHATWYAGITARWRWLFVAARRYGNVITSQSDIDPLYVGPTSGPVVQMLMGISLPL